MTDGHVPQDLTAVRVQAAVDQIRAEVRDLAGMVGRHRAAGCQAPGGACPGVAVIERLSRAACSHRFDLAVAAMILLAEQNALLAQRNTEIATLRAQLIRRAVP